MTRQPRALAVLATAAAIAGCGEKEEPDAASAEAVVAEGDAICREAQSEIDKLRSEPTPTPEATARFTERVIAVHKDEIAALAELAPPPELADELDAYIAERRRALEPLRDGLAAARAGDAAAYADAQSKAAEGQLERTELAAAVGLEACSRPGAGSNPTSTPAP